MTSAGNATARSAASTNARQPRLRAASRPTWKAQPDVLVLDLLDDQPVQVVHWQAALKQHLQLILGHAISRAMSFLDHIARCNNANLADFEPWFIGATQAGFLHRDFLPRIAPRADLFSHRDGAWYLSDALDTPDKRTAALREFLLALRAHGFFKAWRDEDYPVTPAFVLTAADGGWSAPPCRGSACAPFGPHMTSAMSANATACTKAGVTG